MLKLYHAARAAASLVDYKTAHHKALLVIMFRAQTQGAAAFAPHRPGADLCTNEACRDFVMHCCARLAMALTCSDLDPVLRDLLVFFRTEEHAFASPGGLPHL